MPCRSLPEAQVDAYVQHQKQAVIDAIAGAASCGGDSGRPDVA